MPDNRPNIKTALRAQGELCKQSQSILSLRCGGQNKLILHMIGPFALFLKLNEFAVAFYTPAGSMVVRGKV